MKAPEPILTTDLSPELRQHLLSMLNGLTPDEWLLPTPARDWTVKDAALHLVGGDIGVLSRKRDGHSLPNDSISNWHELVAFINGLNRTWVEATRRMSSRVLCDLLAHTGPRAEAYFMSLDPFAPGDSVEWAGPEPQPQWLDIAREYTERWHHQQQIRDATGRPALYEPRLSAPVLDTFRVGTATHFSQCGCAGRHDRATYDYWRRRWRVRSPPGAGCVGTPGRWEFGGHRASPAKG